MDATPAQGGFVYRKARELKDALAALREIRPERLEPIEWVLGLQSPGESRPPSFPASTDDDARNAMLRVDSIVGDIEARSSERYVSEVMGWCREEWQRVKAEIFQAISISGSVVRGVSRCFACHEFEKAVSDLCWRLDDNPDEAILEYHRLEGEKLFRSMRATQSSHGGESAAMPSWNSVSGELTFQGRLKRFHRRATTARPILETFELESWPRRIDDPLPGGRNPERLREAIRTLNTNSIGLVFEADGSGEGIIWKPE